MARFTVLRVSVFWAVNSFISKNIWPSVDVNGKILSSVDFGVSDKVEFVTDLLYDRNVCLRANSWGREFGSSS